MESREVYCISERSAEPNDCRCIKTLGILIGEREMEAVKSTNRSHWEITNDMMYRPC